MSDSHSSTALLDPPASRAPERPAPKRPKRRARIVVPIVIVVVIVLIVAFVIVRQHRSANSDLLTSTVSDRTVSLTAQGTGTVVDAQTIAIGTTGSSTVTLVDGATIAVAGQSPVVQVTSIDVSVGSAVKTGGVLAKVKDARGVQTVIRAPGSGIVRSSAAAVGSSVAGTLFTIGVGPTRVSVPISEYQIGDVTVGQTVSVDLQGLGETKTGAVVSTSPLTSTSSTAASSTSSATSSSSSVTDYTVVVSLPDPPSAVRVGMNAQATIAIKKVDDVLAVPVQALSETSGGKYMVTTLTTTKRSSSTRVVTVGVGLVGDSYAQITSGLASGDSVVTGTSAASTTTTTPTGPRF